MSPNKSCGEVHDHVFVDVLSATGLRHPRGGILLFLHFAITCAWACDLFQPGGTLTFAWVPALHDAIWSLQLSGKITCTNSNFEIELAFLENKYHTSWDLAHVDLDCVTMKQNGLKTGENPFPGLEQATSKETWPKYKRTFSHFAAAWSRYNGVIVTQPINMAISW